jgi:hypothetical protein
MQCALGNILIGVAASRYQTSDDNCLKRFSGTIRISKQICLLKHMKKHSPVLNIKIVVFSTVAYYNISCIYITDIILLHSGAARCQ